MKIEERRPIDFGYAHRVLRWGRAVAMRVRVRTTVVNAVLGGVAVVLAVLAIGIGEYPMSPGEVIGTLLGQGDDRHWMVVVEWRLPSAVAAVCFGALLGVGGAIFQSLTRNPLGSPDVIGFDAGSYTAVVVTIVLVGSTGYWSIASAAIAGGLLTAFLVYVLAYRRGVQGFRLIVVGIGVSAALGSLNSYLITRADIEDAMAVGFWGAGSLSRVSWESLVPSLIIGLVVLAVAGFLSPELRQLELGDDAALAQGVHAGRCRLALLVTGVASTALVTAAAGPIGFVALAAPQLARRITRTPGVSVISAGCMGAALLSGAHFLSRVIAQLYRAVPVGLVTVCLGGLYLIWLLIREARKAG
ncbi:FecCD family ABC transporter permease [Tessaracoccus caeni]|uniref:FecCD family ABC transporter permease n=1 Tax=Tessaracoccus caeni TaxID=3031239 RepID=UPI0023DB69A4|nr:iron chelate uptake ABC transporter family permease subunit [Tessaracoccus caeni]MDF1487101.1 iron chelate uptake ABC transporter family permease subunit [Tessaracoccus caeni]